MPLPSASLVNLAGPALATTTALRVRAEQRQALVTRPVEQHSLQELQRLVHELQAHQIELETQNEALLLAQAEAEAARVRHADLYDAAPAGYSALSATDFTEQLNPCDSQPQAEVLPVDVTEAGQQGRQLVREEEFTQSLLEYSIDGIVALDRESRVTVWNNQSARYFGYPAAQVLGQSLFAVLPHLDNEATRRVVGQVLAGELVLLEGQALPRRTGHFDVYHVPLRRAGAVQPTGILMLFRDVTERDRLAEETICQRRHQQQEVLVAILNTQETERKRIAEALHNGLGQLLYATRLSLEGGGGSPAATLQALRLLEEAIRTTRTISFELTPGILEDFGLRTALEELGKRIASSGLPVRLHLTNLDRQRLRPPVEIMVYRVVQELLNNVMKHAAATEVVVHVVREPGRVEVSVEDNGCGFAPTAPTAQPLAGIGLAGARNRVALLGGELHVRSRLGQGTIVSFAVNE